MYRLRQRLERHEPNDSGDPVYLAYFGSGDPARSGIEATLLPCYLDWREKIDFQPLRPGTYCISATLLQSVYGLAFGSWSSEYERLYRQYAKRLLNRYGTSVSMANIREGRSSEDERMIYEFEHLRFARLCARPSPPRTGRSRGLLDPDLPRLRLRIGIRD